ncbi:MAG: hypothetical protein NTV33_02655 [Coprothermobacterota bacterium]|nr:hypothetical protein [Coprothermobacterota bacterium]
MALYIICSFSLEVALLVHPAGGYHAAGEGGFETRPYTCCRGLSSILVFYTRLRLAIGKTIKRDNGI